MMIAACISEMYVALKGAEVCPLFFFVLNPSSSSNSSFSPPPMSLTNDNCYYYCTSSKILVLCCYGSNVIDNVLPKNLVSNMK